MSIIGVMSMSVFDGPSPLLRAMADHFFPMF
jgi:hypothetical protein